jgi:hypothetical protein
MGDAIFSFGRAGTEIRDIHCDFGFVLCSWTILAAGTGSQQVELAVIEKAGILDSTGCWEYIVAFHFRCVLV